MRARADTRRLLRRIDMRNVVVAVATTSAAAAAAATVAAAAACCGSLQFMRARALDEQSNRALA